MLRAISAGLAVFLCASASAALEDPWKAFEAERAAARWPEGLRLTISAEKAEYFAGEPVLVTLKHEMTGPGKVRVSGRTYDRSGRMHSLKWTAVGPGGRRAADPLEDFSFSPFGGGLGSSHTVEEGKPFSQGFYVNEWVRFDLEGDYEIAVISSRLDGAGSVASDRIRIRIRKPTDAEVDAAIARYVKAIDEKVAIRMREEGLGYRKAGLFLRFLHHERALPHYFRCLAEKEIGFDAGCGIFGMADRGAAFAALTAKLAEKDYPISGSAYGLYVMLHGLLNPPPEGAELRWPTELAAEQIDAVTARLRKLAESKSPRARAISAFALTPPNETDAGYATQLAGCLKDMPPELFSEAVFRVGLKKNPEIVPCLEGYLDHDDEAVRSSAVAGLIRQGLRKYLEMYLDDYVSAEPRFRNIYDHPKDLTAERQLKLAALLDQPERKVAERAAKRLARYATSKEVVPFIRKGLERWKETYGPGPAMFEAWARVDPEGAKAPLIEFIRGGRQVHDAGGSLKHYVDDPDVVQLLVKIARSDRGYWQASSVLVRARHPEVVPVLLERARAADNMLCGFGRPDRLEEVTGHLVPLTAEHNTREKQMAVLDEWQRWWEEYRDRPPVERARSNVEYCLRLLDVETGGLCWRAHHRLQALTGHRIGWEVIEDKTKPHGHPLKYDRLKLKRLWTAWWEANRETFRPLPRPAGAE